MQNQFTMANSKISGHSLPQSILLHILPGLLTGAAYFALVPAVRSLGFPSVMALSLAGIFVLVPFELGWLFFQKRKTGEPFFKGIIRYVKPLKVLQYLLWVPVIFLASGLLFTVFKFSAGLLRPVFDWINPGLLLDMGLNNAFTTSRLIITDVVFLLTVVVVLPVTEELYFRGYLLPRMPSELKGWAPVVHSALFALYHTWTPWMFLTRAIGVLPLILVVKRKENIYLGIIVHCLLNSLDLIQGVAYLFGR